MIKYVLGWHYKTKEHYGLKMEGNLTPLRTVQEYEIEIYNEPCIRTYRNGSAFSVNKGDVLIALPGDERQSKPHFECYALKFLCDDCEFAAKIKEISGVHSFGDCTLLIEELQSIYDLAGQFNKELLLDAKIRLFLAQLYEKFLEDKTENYIHRVELNNAERFIQENLHQKLTLSEIAHNVGLSSSLLHKIFKEYYNLSPYSFLVSKRMEYAKTILLNNLISIDEIAEKCGFSSRAYFDVTFKKFTGFTPAAFRDKTNC